VTTVPPGARARVLVADDHVPLRDRIVALLSQDFQVVGTARDGQTLIETEALLQPDVVVVDISMPDMSGLEAAARMRSRGSRAALVYITAHRDGEILDAAVGAGALGFVAKTFLAEDLVPAIHAALAGRRFVSPCVSDAPGPV